MIQDAVAHDRDTHPPREPVRHLSVEDYQAEKLTALILRILHP
jgi:hypothetical protein